MCTHKICEHNSGNIYIRLLLTRVNLNELHRDIKMRTTIGNGVSGYIEPPIYGFVTHTVSGG